MIIHQINLQPHFGGGEVYTAFLSRALDRLGVHTVLYTHPRADFWGRLGLPATTRVEPVVDATTLARVLAGIPGWILGHGPLPGAVLAARQPAQRLTAIAHMPLQGRNPRSFAGHDCVFAVSGWVLDGLRTVGAAVWPTPLLGVADLSDRPGQDPIRRTSRYDWDRRKGRDRLLGWLEPLAVPLRARPLFARRPGLTLGIVSRLTPIKQFPKLFSQLAPVLARHPGIHLEIFGSGGYASVRDLDQVLRPLAGRVRFWGQQRNVKAVYAQLDYLLTGLPEKEALGLNVIEAQACDLPVLAPRAAPFTETIADGRTGWLYTDPRQDGGADFERLLTQLIATPAKLHPAQAGDHLAQFTLDALTERLRPVVAWARETCA